MPAQTEVSMQRQAAVSWWVRWLQLAAVAAALLLLSQVVWLWQTWPVRELLPPPPPSTPVASSQQAS